MNLFVYIFSFAPALIGVIFYNKLLKKNFCKLDIIRTIIYILLSNFIGLSILYFLKGFNISIYAQLEAYSFYAVRYSFMLITINMVIGYVNAFLSKNFDIYFEGYNETSSKKDILNK